MPTINTGLANYDRKWMNFLLQIATTYKPLTQNISYMHTVKAIGIHRDQVLERGDTYSCTIVERVKPAAQMYVGV